VVVVVGFALGVAGAPTRAQVTGQAPELDRVGVDEHLGAQLPLDAPFRDQDGRAVTLGDYLDGERPVVFVLAYHRCRVLCSLVLNAVIDAMKDLPWTVGQEYDFVSVSIDPKDTPEAASGKRDQAVSKYGRSDAAGWHFLVGEERDIQRLAAAAGFRFFYDERQDQYAHPAVVMLLTPDGRMARYLYGLDFPASDVRLGLLEASEGRSISTVEQVLIYCYRYDPQGKTYAVVATRVMQLGGILTVVGLGAFLGIMWRREVGRRRARGGSAPATPLPGPAEGQAAKS